jgi:hypothetical protein
MSGAQYQEWKKAKLEDNSAWEEWEPVAYFELPAGQLSALVKLDHLRVAKYVFLLPTGFRKNHEEKFLTEPLSLQFFGVQGKVITEKQSILNQRRLTKNRFLL